MSVHPVVLLGTRRFSVQWQWLDASRVQGISSVAVTSGQEIIVACRQEPHIRIFDSHARLVNEFSIEGLRCPHHLSIDANDNLWITDLDGHRVFAVDMQGHIMHILGDDQQPHWQAPFNHPTHAILCDEGLWVSDGYGNAAVHYFDPSLVFQNSLGSPGQGVGQFSVPHMLASYSDCLYVVDRENHRVQVFNKRTQQFLFSFDRLYKPMSIAVYADTGLLVSDQTAALSLFSWDGALLGRCRVNAVYGHGLAAHIQGNIYIATMLPDGLACFTPLE